MRVTRRTAWIVAGGFSALYLVLYALSARASAIQPLLDVMAVALGVSLPLAAGLAATGATGRDRKIWIALALIGVLSGTAELLRVFAEAPPGASTAISRFADYLFLGSYACMFYVASSLFVSRVSGNVTRLRYTLDVAAITVILGSLGHTFLAGTFQPGMAGVDAHEAVLSMVFPLLDIVLLEFALIVALGSDDWSWRSWELLLISAVALAAVGDILMTLALANAPEAQTIDLLNRVTILASTVVATMAPIHWLTQEHVAERRHPTRSRARLVIQGLALPTLALAAVVLLGYHVLNPGSAPESQLAVWSIVTLSVLVIGRGMLVALENQVLEEATLTDPLTALYNTRMFRERLSEELARAKRTGEPLSIATIDVDDFARINNLHGHDVGDACIKYVADRLLASVRAFDTVCRVGGDEFSIIMPGATADDARRVCSRVREHLSQDGPDLPCGEPISVSTGIASFPQFAQDADSLVRSADSAMYWVKYHGRDGVMAYDPELVEALDSKARLERDEDRMRVQAVEILASAVNARIPDTQHHAAEVARLARMLGHALELPTKTIGDLEVAAYLHDVGKIGIPDDVLIKPARLSREERLLVEGHPQLGQRILSAAPLDEIGQWVAAHHERWDGAGYPCGLVGEDIPLGARVLAICDAFEAMSAEQAYSPALTREEALEELRAGAGTQFDPRLVELFCDALER